MLNCDNFTASTPGSQAAITIAGNPAASKYSFNFRCDIMDLTNIHYWLHFVPYILFISISIQYRNILDISDIDHVTQNQACAAVDLCAGITCQQVCSIKSKVYQASNVQQLLNKFNHFMVILML